MKYSFAIVVAVLALAMGQVSAQVAEKSAEAAALSWLALTDREEFAPSWDQAAAIFRASISRAEWVAAVTRVRQPLGKLISRKLQSATYTRSLPGAPDGEYVVIRYETQFEHKQTAIETITPLLDADGAWRVSGYFIH